MHYDIESGVTDNRGLFSKLTVIILLILLTLFGFYMVVNWFAPDIFFIASDNRSTIENIVKNQPVDDDMLRVPLLEIEREIVPKKADGKIQISQKDNRIVLSGAAHTLGVTPFDTKKLSPLALLDRASDDMRVYVDLDGTRTTYQVKEVLEDTQPNLNPTDDLVIYALDNTGKTAVTEVRAEKLGEVKI